jgi:hypothetical protein
MLAFFDHTFGSASTAAFLRQAARVYPPASSGPAASRSPGRVAPAGPGPGGLVRVGPGRRARASCDRVFRRGGAERVRTGAGAVGPAAGVGRPAASRAASSRRAAAAAALCRAGGGQRGAVRAEPGGQAGADPGGGADGGGVAVLAAARARRSRSRSIWRRAAGDEPGLYMSLIARRVCQSDSPPCRARSG